MFLWALKISAVWLALMQFTLMRPSEVAKSFRCFIRKTGVSGKSNHDQ